MVTKEPELIAGNRKELCFFCKKQKTCKHYELIKYIYRTNLWLCSACVTAKEFQDRDISSVTTHKDNPKIKL